MIKAVIAYSGLSETGNLYSPEVIKSIVQQVNSNVCIPVHRSSGFISTSTTLIGSAHEAEVQVVDGRTEALVTLKLALDSVELTMRDSEGAFLVSPSVSGFGDVTRNNGVLVVNKFTLDCILVTPRSECSMPHCRMWGTPEVAPDLLIDASSSDEFQDQFINQLNRGAARFYDLLGMKKLFEIGSCDDELHC